MPEYRAFDSRGDIVGLEDLTDTDSAVAWGLTIAKNGAVLVERKNDDDWVCFQEFRDKRASSEAQPG